MPRSGNKPRDGAVLVVFGRMRPSVEKLIWLICFGSTLHGQGPEQPPAPEPLRVSLVLAAGDDEAVLEDMTRLWDHMGRGPFPTIIAMEPGPLDLAHGLRLLPNEIVPKLSPPDILLISSRGALDDLFFAFMRRCLREHIKVWVVGPDFPPSLCAFPLDPGFVIERIDQKDLFLRLQQEFRPAAREEAVPNLLEAPR